VCWSLQVLRETPEPWNATPGTRNFLIFTSKMSHFDYKPILLFLLPRNGGRGGFFALVQTGRISDTMDRAPGRLFKPDNCAAFWAVVHDWSMRLRVEMIRKAGASFRRSGVS
jgi:hypothetical protein